MKEFWLLKEEVGTKNEFCYLIEGEHTFLFFTPSEICSRCGMYQERKYKNNNRILSNTQQYFTAKVMYVGLL
jgi:hypothetical protein